MTSKCATRMEPPLGFDVSRVCLLWRVEYAQADSGVVNFYLGEESILQSSDTEISGRVVFLGAPEVAPVLRRSGLRRPSSGVDHVYRALADRRN
jgi:hypothetical protein